MDKKQIKCKACGTVLSNIYGSVEDPQLAPENGNTKELYPNNKNDMACYFCGPACVSKFTSMTKWNGDEGIKDMNDFTDGSLASEKDKYGNEHLIVDIARYISTKDRNKMKDSEFVDSKRRSFPIKTCEDIHAAISSWGRYKGSMSFSEFKEKITRKAHEMGCTLPKSWNEDKK